MTREEITANYAIEASATNLLYTALSAAVPLWILQAKKRPPATTARLGELAQIIAEKGDVILYPSEKAGETAKAFNALAEALGELAFVDGGVDFGPLHFEAKRSLRLT